MSSIVDGAALRSAVDDLLWETAVPTNVAAPPLPAAAARVVRAIREGRAGELFPPVLSNGPDGVVGVGRWLSTASDASLVSHVLAQPRFVPLVEMFTDLDTWCRWARRRFAGVIDPRVLTIANADLFAPLVTRAFIACAARPVGFTRRLVALQRARFETLLSAFFVRLRDDARTHWFTDPGFALPVIGVRAHGGETHNGGERVLRLELAGGRKLAYKPRRADGETLFLAETASVFALLNRLPSASGAVRLPVLACRSGGGPYLWQEWVEPPMSWGTIRRSGEFRLHGTLLRSDQADRFWHRAGSLSAACFAFGISDLGEGNLLAGTRPGDDEPLYYPVDLEVFLVGVGRLHATHLVTGARGQDHHCGLERTARWCTVDGPLAGFAAIGAGTMQLRRIRRPWARQETRTVVADDRGRTGYGPYLIAFLRGMFDAWTLMCRNRDRIARLFDREANVRVLLNHTSIYQQAIDNRLLAGRGASPVRFGRGEAEQLRRSDVPYFFRSTRGGPLLRWDPVQERAVVTRHGPTLPPDDRVRRGERLTLAGLGVALRDAVAYVFADLDRLTAIDAKHGVTVRLADEDTGEVSFEWLEVGKRVTYSWDAATVRLGLDDTAGPRKTVVPAGVGRPAGGGRDAAPIEHRLLRLARVDAALRDRWARTGFADEAVAGKLRALSERAASWLREIIAEHGWPGRALVSTAAVDAACLLVQHLEDQLPFQRRCLELIRAAAEAGDLPWRHVAYLTDTIRLSEGKPQLYGTKFRADGGTLVPYPIEAPEQVDERRARMGLEPLADYAQRLRRRFLLPLREDE